MKHLLDDNAKLDLHISKLRRILEEKEKSLPKFGAPKRTRVRKPSPPETLNEELPKTIELIKPFWATSNFSYGDKKISDKSFEKYIYNELNHLRLHHCFVAAFTSPEFFKCLTFSALSTILSKFKSEYNNKIYLNESKKLEEFLMLRKLGKKCQLYSEKCELLITQQVVHLNGLINQRNTDEFPDAFLNTTSLLMLQLQNHMLSMEHSVVQSSVDKFLAVLLSRKVMEHFYYCKNLQPETTNRNASFTEFPVLDRSLNLVHHHIHKCMKAIFVRNYNFESFKEIYLQVLQFEKAVLRSKNYRIQKSYAGLVFFLTKFFRDKDLRHSFNNPEKVSDQSPAKLLQIWRDFHSQIPSPAVNLRYNWKFLRSIELLYCLVWHVLAQVLNSMFQEMKYFFLMDFSGMMENWTFDLDLVMKISTRIRKEFKQTDLPTCQFLEKSLIYFARVFFFLQYRNQLYYAGIEPITPYPENIKKIRISQSRKLVFVKELQIHSFMHTPIKLCNYPTLYAEYKLNDCYNADNPGHNNEYVKYRFNLSLTNDVHKNFFGKYLTSEQRLKQDRDFEENELRSFLFTFPQLLPTLKNISIDPHCISKHGLIDKVDVSPKDFKPKFEKFAVKPTVYAYHEVRLHGYMVDRKRVVNGYANQPERYVP